eukprot:1441009-Alexandrium_andersonii.AAC.1
MRTPSGLRPAMNRLWASALSAAQAPDACGPPPLRAVAPSPARWGFLSAPWKPQSRPGRRPSGPL